MAELTQALPPYQFLVAFSQLVSRVTHPNADVFNQLEVRTTRILYALHFIKLLPLQVIVLKLLKHFPQQALWMMIAISKVIL